MLDRDQDAAHVRDRNRDRYVASPAQISTGGVNVNPAAGSASTAIDYRLTSMKRPSTARSQ